MNFDKEKLAGASGDMIRSKYYVLSSFIRPQLDNSEATISIMDSSDTVGRIILIISFLLVLL